MTEKELFAVNQFINLKYPFRVKYNCSVYELIVPLEKEFGKLSWLDGGPHPFPGNWRLSERWTFIGRDLCFKDEADAVFCKMLLC